MFEILIKAFVAFWATHVDNLILLFLLYSTQRYRKQVKAVFLGQVLGLGFLVGISALTVYGISRIPFEGLSGWLGLIPLGLGIHGLVKHHTEEYEEELLESAERVRTTILSLFLVSVASGADNVGLYVPLFANQSLNEILLTFGIFLGLLVLLNLLAYLPSGLNRIKESLERMESVLVPWVFIVLGVVILAESGIFGMFLG